MKKVKMISWLTLVSCLLPFLLGGLGSVPVTAAAETVDVTLHKKKMDQFPSEEVENTGSEMTIFEQYEGLPGVTFSAWDITDDFHAKLNARLQGNESAEDYATIRKTLMQEYVLDKDNSTQVGAAQETDKDGKAYFKELPKRDEKGVYKVYFFEEHQKDGVTKGKYPLILALPVISGENEITDIHLYPKNKMAGNIGKVIVDEEGEEVEAGTEGRYDYELGKKIRFKAYFTIPNQIGEILNDGDENEVTRYTELSFVDQVSVGGMKFEGLEAIEIEDEPIIPADFLAHGRMTTFGETPEAGTHAGFKLVMNLNDKNKNDDPAAFAISKSTAEFLSQYAGKEIAFFYSVSFTELTPVDTDIENNFTVEMTHDGEEDDKEASMVPKFVTGGHKFLKYEADRTSGAKIPLKDAKFVVIKKEGAVSSYLAIANDTVAWTDFNEGTDLSGTDAKVYTSETDGLISVAGLAFGTYYLREIAAPDGFQLLAEDIEFTVAKGSFDDTVKVEIENVTKGGFLPSTGGTGIAAFLIIGSLLMCGAVVRYRRIARKIV